MSNKTIQHWYERIEEWVSWDLNARGLDHRIGGDRIVVEIDESTCIVYV